MLNSNSTYSVKNLLHININEEWLHAPGASANHRMFAVVQGTLRLWTADGTLSVNAGECTFVSSVTRIRCAHSDDTGLDFFELEFVGNMTASPLKLYRADKNTLSLLALIEKASDSGLKSKLFDIFCEFVTENPIDKNSEKELCNRIREYIDANPEINLDVDAVARALGFDRSHISRVFKKGTDKTIKSYINNRRVLYAKSLLESSDFTINKIASLTGFEESNLFTKFFTYHTGLTPSDYRRQLHGIEPIHNSDE